MSHNVLVDVLCSIFELILLMMESLLITLVSIILGVALLYLAVTVAGPLLQSHVGLVLTPTWLTSGQWQLLGILLLFGSMVGAIPGFKAYRQSLADGMAVRI